MKIRLNPNRHRAGFAGISASVIAVAATVASTAYGIVASENASARAKKFQNQSLQIQQEQADAYVKTQKAIADSQTAQANAEIQAAYVDSTNNTILLKVAGGALLLGVVFFILNRKGKITKWKDFSQFLV